MRRRQLWPLAALYVWLAACTRLGPDYAVPPEARLNDPQAQAALDLHGNGEVAAAALPDDWWQLYEDPLLDQLIAASLSHNSDLRQAYHSLRVTQQSYAMARAANDVVYGGSATAGRGQLSSEALALQEKLPVMNLVDVGVSVGYQVDLFGKLRRATEAAAADTQARQAALELAQISVVSGVARSYLRNCVASEELQIARRSLAIQEQQLDVAQRFLAAGRGNEVDVARAQAQTESLRAQLPSFDARKQAALYQLAALLGRTPGDLPPSVAACERPPQLKQALPVGDGAALLKRRPDVRMAERELAAATARIGVATAQMYPEIVLGAGFGYTGMLEHTGDPITRRWDLMPSISWHIPTRVDRARVRASEAGADLALARLDGVVLEALRETQTQLSNYAHSLQRKHALEQARDAARQAAEANRALYREGRLAFLDSLDSERTLAAAEAQLAACEAQLVEDQINLFLALGGGWQGTGADKQAGSVSR